MDGQISQPMVHGTYVELCCHKALSSDAHPQLANAACAGRSFMAIGRSPALCIRPSRRPRRQHEAALPGKSLGGCAYDLGACGEIPAATGTHSQSLACGTLNAGTMFD